MMGVKEIFDPNTAKFPLDRYGLKLMSMGFIVKPETAMIWRGPMITNTSRLFSHRFRG
ncbi:MAG: P-loop NTPase, partial [Methanobacterium sp.]